MGEKTEKVLLHEIYKSISSIKKNITQEKFYGYIIPSKASKVEDSRTMGKYIRKKMPECVREYYRETNNKACIVEYLKKWCDYVRSDRDAIFNAIISVLKLTDVDNANSYLIELFAYRLLEDTKLFYELFRYCITQEKNNYDAIKLEEKNHAVALEEFNKLILTQYGISGRTGRSVILQLASSETTKNPYILFEAAEIEYMQRYDASGRTDNESLETAYKYYKRASDLGFALADWSLGYLAQMCNEKAWDIKAYRNMSPEDQIKTAIEYFEKSMQQGCSKGYNSMGNIVKNHAMIPDLSHKLKSAKEYYRQSAELGNIFGMYNYARTLEKELKELIKSPDFKEVDITEYMIKLREEMVNYYKVAADCGNSIASYRYAVYCGQLSDEKAAVHENFPWESKNEAMAIKYLRNAAVPSLYEICYDAMLFLTDYILHRKWFFYNWRYELDNAKTYMKKINNGLILTKEANARQKKQYTQLKQELSQYCTESDLQEL